MRWSWMARVVGAVLAAVGAAVAGAGGAAAAAADGPVGLAALEDVRPLLAEADAPLVAGGDDPAAAGGAAGGGPGGAAGAGPLAGVPADEAALFEAVLARVRAARGGPIDVPPWPARFVADTAPRVVMLSVSGGRSTARSAVGSGRGIVAALEAALAQVAPAASPAATPPTPGSSVPTAAAASPGSSAPSAGPASPGSPAFPASAAPVLWVRLDVVQHVSPPLAVTEQEGGLVEVRPGEAGLLPGPDGLDLLLLEEILANGLIDGGRLDRAAVPAHLARRRPPGAPPAAEVPPQLERFRTFTTRGFAFDGVRSVRLRNGCRDEPLTPERLLDACQAGGEYLVRCVGRDGRFVYLRDFSDGSISKDYNILRHAGTTYAMLELYAASGDAQVLAAAERAIGYLLAQMHEETAGGEPVAIVLEDGDAKLGANALAALALAEHARVTGDQRHLETARRLARWMLSVQIDTGRFTVHKRRMLGMRIDYGFESSYYPGEATLALVRLAELDPDGPWLAAASRAAKYLITDRDRFETIDTIEHDHWLLIALNELHRRDPDPLYVRHSLLISEAILRAQLPADGLRGWSGGFGTPPRCTPAATRSEALVACWRLLTESAGPEQAAAADARLAALLRAARFQLDIQFRPERAMFLAQPAAAVGGFHGRFYRYDVRNDYVQHNVSSLLGLRRILIDRAR